MKKKSVVAFGLGIVLGVLLAPKKGSETFEELKEKSNNLYLQAKELDIDTIKDKIDDIKIEITKLDYERSKELVSQQATVIKDKLSKLIVDLQENKKIQPALEGAINSTEKAIIDVIDYIDENELIDKTKDGAQKVYEKSNEYADNFKEKASEVIDKTATGANNIVDKTTSKVKEVSEVMKEADEVLDEEQETEKQ